MSFCSKCGGKVNTGDLFCGQCGKKIDISFQKTNTEIKKSNESPGSDNNKLNTNTNSTKNYWVITIVAIACILAAGLWVLTTKQSTDSHSETSQAPVTDKQLTSIPLAPAFPTAVSNQSVPADIPINNISAPTAELPTVQRDNNNYNPNQNSDEYVSIIKSFVQAEDRRDIVSINKYLSSNMSRYWDIINPAYEAIYDRYQHIWSVTPYSKNQILHIEKQNESTYILFTRFEYFSNDKQKLIIKDNRVCFVFDDDIKIKEIYGLD